MENAPDAHPIARHRPMAVRILIGLLGGTGFTTILFWPWWNGVPFAAGVTLFAVWAIYELYAAVRRQGAEPSDAAGMIACIVFQYAAWTYHGPKFAPYLPALLTLMVIAAMIAEFVKRNRRPILNVGVTVLGAIYVGWLFSYLILLRNLDASAVVHVPAHGTTSGQWLVLFVTAATWLSDAGALFVGRALGRHKMAPSLSPGKTWEGSIGGVVFSMLCVLPLGLRMHLPVPHILGLAALCAIAGQIGDLAESAFKRDLGIKDTGTVFPGHGGVLDRIDSLLFSFPLAYYYILFLMLHRG